MFPWKNNKFETKRDLFEAHDELFEPLVPTFSKGGARVRIAAGGSSCSYAAAELEGYSRPLWGIVSYQLGGGEFQYWELYRKGLVSGCDPKGDEYWGDPEGYSQILVDMAAVAYALCRCKDHYWDPLEPSDKTVVIEYLQNVRTKEFAGNNWKFFKVLVDLALEKVGVDIETVSTEIYLEDIESMYLGDGWYGDGKDKKHRIDYYNGFAFHYYGLIYYKLKKHEDPERCARYLQRATEFSKQYIHWFDSEGAAIPYGRSLNYKFATVGFWGLYASVLDINDSPAIPWGVLKYVYLSHFKWWSKQPISNYGSKLLTLGYAYPNNFMTELYNSPQSPYWSMKAFTGLLMDESHPFWTATPQQHHLDTKYMDIIGMHFSHHQKNSIVLVNGPWHDEYQPEKYSKFAYSSRYGFGVITNHRSFKSAHLDNMIGFSFNNKEFWVREYYEAWVAANGVMVSKWSPTYDVTVQSYLIPGDEYHIRIHTIENGTSRQLFTKEGGFAVDMNSHKCDGETDERISKVTTATDYSIICNILGERTTLLCKTEPNANLVFSKALIPELHGIIAPNSKVTFGSIISANLLANGSFSIDDIKNAEKKANISFEGASGPLKRVFCNQ
ncbi:hypothetical protein PSN45_000481 [Yamadazyma tenuis]|uniref:DUF2264 domain-containing protein n=1 Tax=Candida tenuis (strain ATCC 10573 / BCRC 21748 / CBS 615 / JCM 9827 / NBRC 10315 / NRRL Y-1498 / VKM Y-70) TaxID=590646 RepID=G3B8X0_CANTC|nr:uncharacterized protein CANTEDRAFT_107809 [Yamadazyma tenuis ATCC 10573]EGV61797.1 hypothetical protein CANTEDRAFT_107809 [Yamadazyma tenuis ATCC 10573]WEJ93022.1 hypothetical protein PSN45_000481 [Yamadazyma tenuis]